MSCTERGMDGRYRARFRAFDTFLGSSPATRSAELKAGEPGGFELGWSNPDDGLCSARVRVQNPDSGEMLFLEDRGPLIHARRLYPGRVTVQVACKDSERKWVPKTSEYRNGQWVERGGYYRTIQHTTNIGMNFANVPAGARLHVCIYVGWGGVGNGKREYRLAAAEDRRYCEPLRKLTDHFALPFVVNMLEYE
ncbi:MAG: hypothetical protein NXI24_05220 [bacterium]|nr:hypothetical protein [bacterium]